MYMKTRDSARTGSAIKLHGIVSCLIVPLKMFIYGKKGKQLETLKSWICKNNYLPKKIKMIAKTCYSKICFDEPAVLEQVNKLYRNLLSSPSCTMCAVLYRCLLSATLDMTTILIVNCHILVGIESVLQ